SITSVQQTKDGNAVLVSTLDSAIRLMNKGNGQLLQSYKGHTNSHEDGLLYAWDLLEGKVVEKLRAHDGKVASAVVCNAVRKEWASGGVDGSVTVWGMPE
ncbi:MAG: hypothetical protein Q9191_002973, partial [Dirinaria sp. TL-2023a]